MKINEILKQYDLVASRYEKKGKVNIIDTNRGKVVYKDTKVNKKAFDYLKSRNFDYLPMLISNNDDYQITEYIDEIKVPGEQKILDMISLVSLLHSKTTHFVKTSDEYDKLYDDLNGNLEYLYGYYTDMICLIESKVYMSPCEYLLARNINVIYEEIERTKSMVEKWHALVENKKNIRKVLLHNNLKLDHFIENENKYLINWDKSKIDSPAFDLFKLYRNHALDFDFEEVFKKYEEVYPLMEDERLLLYILISMLPIINFNGTTYSNTIEVSKMIRTISKTRDLTKEV